jgi:hypothetical protein
MVEVALIPVLIVLFPSEADATLRSASRRRHSFSASMTGKGRGKAEGWRNGRCSECIYFESVLKGRLDAVDNT